MAAPSLRVLCARVGTRLLIAGCDVRDQHCWGNISFGSAGSEAHCRFRKFNPPGGCPSFALFAKGGRQLIAQSPCRLHKTLRTSGMQHTTWGLIVCWIYHGISHREIAGDVSCSMLRSYPLLPRPRGARARRLAWGWSRCWCWAGAPVLQVKLGRKMHLDKSPSRRCRPARLKARASHQKSPLVVVLTEPDGKTLQTEGAGHGKVLWKTSRSQPAL